MSRSPREDTQLDGSPGAYTVGVFFRSPSGPGPHESQRELLDTVGQLEREGIVDSHRVTLLGRKLCACEQCAESPLARERLAEIERWRKWARSESVSLLVDERPVASSITGETYRFVVPPTVTVVVRDQDGIETVTPHVREGDLVTPRDYLSARLGEVQGRESGETDEQMAE